MRQIHRELAQNEQVEAEGAATSILRANYSRERRAPE
jgi:hypothetical protein